MFEFWSPILLIAPAIVGFAGVLLFYFASLAVPRSRMTTTRDSDFEVRFRRSQGICFAIGSVLVTLALAGGLLDALVAYLA